MQCTTILQHKALYTDTGVSRIYSAINQQMFH